MQPKLLTVPEAARRLGLPTWSTYEIIRRGLIRPVRIGRRIRVSERVLEQFIADGGAASASDAA